MHRDHGFCILAIGSKFASVDSIHYNHEYVHWYMYFHIQYNVCVEGSLQGVNFLWMLKISNIHGQKFVVHTVILTFVSKYFMVIFPTTKKQNFLPIRKCPLFGMYGHWAHMHIHVCAHTYILHMCMCICVYLCMCDHDPLKKFSPDKSLYCIFACMFVYYIVCMLYI